MAKKQWQLLTEIEGTLNADILRGFLEAQGVSVLLSQEGVGHYIYATNIGTLGRVEVLVPEDQLALARQILEDFEAGVYADTPPMDTSSDEEQGEEY